MSNEILIAVLAGGLSSERDVSFKSADAVGGALKRLGYRTVVVDATENVVNELQKHSPDVAFNALHGKYGEDGTIQGVLEFLRIPYTGSGVGPSAIAMDKILSKRLFLAEQIPTAPYRVVDLQGFDATVRDADSLNYPLVVKPRCEGSSVGVSLVKEAAQLSAALESAFTYDSEVLIESFVRGREIQIGILERRILGSIEVKPSNEFYDYEAKYTAGKTQYIVSPDLPAGVFEDMAGYALRAAEAIDCEGAVRVDFIVDERNVPYILEVNTLPGLTETSLYPKIAKQAGIEFDQLVETLLFGARLKL